MLQRTPIDPRCNACDPREPLVFLPPFAKRLRKRVTKERGLIDESDR